ncbi:hypothetical protein DFH06DRAFT_1292009 [Mycena polygramma]|nr:hypothetical protein DFH06DRAFT_1292009 [Mycena polygramma]
MANLSILGAAGCESRRKKSKCRYKIWYSFEKKPHHKILAWGIVFDSNHWQADFGGGVIPAKALENGPSPSKDTSFNAGSLSYPVFYSLWPLAVTTTAASLDATRAGRQFSILATCRICIDCASFLAISHALVPISVSVPLPGALDDSLHIIVGLDSGWQQIVATPYIGGGYASDESQHVIVIAGCPPIGGGSHWLSPSTLSLSLDARPSVEVRIG